MRRFGFRFRRALVAMMLASLVVGAAVASAGGPSGRFKANGHRLYLECSGSGKPTVVLDAGLGSDHTDWAEIRARASLLHTRVCAYDRYGLGYSDGTHVQAKVRTIAKVVSDLHALLRSAKLAPPYVFVGHSMGGLIDREYARHYPKDVAGMVLLDTAPDDWDLYTGTRIFTYGMESLNVVAASAALRRHDSLGAKPVVVIEADNDLMVMQWVHGKSESDFQAYWDSAQRALARISSNSIFAVATGSTHMIPENAPRLTVEAIRLVLVAARAHKRLPACMSTKLPGFYGDCNAPQAPAPSDGGSQTTTTTTTTS